MKVKPFTLDWWIEQLLWSVWSRDVASNRPNNQEIVKRYEKLTWNIRRRIVRKYGERPE